MNPEIVFAILVKEAMIRKAAGMQDRMNMAVGSTVAQRMRNAGGGPKPLSPKRPTGALSFGGQGDLSKRMKPGVLANRVDQGE